MKKGFSLVEMLIVMLLMSVMMIVMLPVLSVKKKVYTGLGGSSASQILECLGDATSITFDSTTGKMTKALGDMSGACAAAVNACVYGMADCTTVKTYAEGSGSDIQQYNAEKILRASCDLSPSTAAMACNYWVNERCYDSSDATNCNKTADDATYPLKKFFDMYYYLDPAILTNDPTNQGTDDIISQSKVQYAMNSINNVTAKVNEWCSNDSAGVSAACKVIFDECNSNPSIDYACYALVDKCHIKGSSSGGISPYCDVSGSTNYTMGYYLKQADAVDNEPTNNISNRIAAYYPLASSDAVIKYQTESLCSAYPDKRGCKYIYDQCNSNDASDSCKYFVDRCANDDSKCDINGSIYDFHSLLGQSSGTHTNLISQTNSYYNAASGASTSTNVRNTVKTDCGSCTDTNYVACQVINPASLYGNINTCIIDGCNRGTRGSCSLGYTGGINTSCYTTKNNWSSAPDNSLVSTDNTGTAGNYNCNMSSLATAAITGCNAGFAVDCAAGYNNNWNRSCKQIKDSWNTTADGTYRITTNGVDANSYVLTKCDMTNGGWTLVANNLGNVDFDSSSYSNGYNLSSFSASNPLSTNWAHKSSLYDNFPNIVMKINIGTVKDYFRPASGTFSSMVTSFTNHRWASNSNLVFITPSYYNVHLGGSLDYWPLNNISGDSRRFLSFWGSSGYSIGGCCHATYSDDTSASTWGRAFTMWVKENISEPGYKSCLEIKNANPSLPDGTYAIDPDGTGGNPSFLTYCDMTTDGGGWTLIGKGREGWTWSNAGQSITSELLNFTTNTVATLPATTVNNLIYGNNVKNLVDGIRIKRNNGLNQTIIYKFTDMNTFDWNMAAYSANYILNGVNYGVSSVVDAWSSSGNDCTRTFIWSWEGHNYLMGWSTGSTCTATLYPGSYEYDSYGHCIPQSTVWIRN